MHSANSEPTSAWLRSGPPRSSKSFGVDRPNSVRALRSDLLRIVVVRRSSSYRGKAGHSLPYSGDGCSYAYVQLCTHSVRVAKRGRGLGLLVARTGATATAPSVTEAHDPAAFDHQQRRCRH